MPTPLDRESYISLETFKKDGAPIRTPVWAAPLDDMLVVTTDAGTFKVKRIRNNARVRVAACNATGRTIRGPWYEGTARIVASADAPRAEAALNRKYGLQRRTFNFFARLFGGLKNRVIIEITLTPPAIA